MFYKFHSTSPWLKRVLVPFWAFQITFTLTLVSIFVWLRGDSGFQSSSTDVAVLIISAVCTVLSVTEIVLFAAIRLHPLTYLVLQAVKTTTWLVLFALAATNTTRVRTETKTARGDGGTVSDDYFLLGGFLETLVLFTTSLGALLYATTVHHRHRRAKSRFLRSLHPADLFPVPAPRTIGAKESNPPPPPPQASECPCRTGTTNNNNSSKEALEVTVLRELGGGWDLYELPATARSVRSSRGAGSVRGLR